ncbi:carboxypeptidase-like regulatory domain-containing protein [Cytophagaceae bacterium YF14B1]|uniref:Carboxypeptidase-like regulatory domain-containing protein n=1 Tax=Xanthocytophaga flava TaxID=3048013 RepID=A0AAE3U7S6_9BACT|nr:carboxypeptidase-like regulatory domain-containing protein [Xanthocytophaga flavus]MDJ1481937.1 carboxypeptidase-like regulatory domain-containing protein [Xanthocytophaga flavus]
MITKVLLATSLVFTLFACSCKKDSDTTSPGDSANPDWGSQPPLPVVNGEATFHLSGNEFYVNVMGNVQPRTPNFPSLSVKKGVLRGYVADLSGKPIKGAYIGVRVTVIGGSYSGASAETNEKGYYEINLPIGPVHYYATGYTIDYGDGRAVVGLHPADDNTSGFASETGNVENFVLESYGVGDKEEVLHQPSNSNNYYGGSISLDYQVDWDHNVPNYLPADGEIELQLIPQEPGLYGETKSFKIYKKIGYTKLIIVNIPIGKYTIKAKLTDGRELKMREVGTYAGYYPAFGLKPAEAKGSAGILFTPVVGRTPQMVPAHGGNWESTQIQLELP